jgi:multidrug efflux pump subunit AcrA (membrane-fusion protein)
VPPSGLKELALGQIVIVNKERSTIDAIERSIDPKTRTGFATVKLKECPKCIIGSSVSVDIIIENNAHAVMINRNAIFYEKKQSYVVVIKKDSDGTQRAEYRKVSVGKEQDGLVHVVDGITPGELIVTANPKRLRPQVLLRVHS